MQSFLKQGLLVMLSLYTFTVFGQKAVSNQKAIPGQKADTPRVDTPRVDQLDLMVVTASRTAQKRTEAPIAISTISAKTIADTKANQLDQLLNKVSGVFMVDLGNEQHEMSIRQPMSTASVFPLPGRRPSDPHYWRIQSQCLAGDECDGYPADRSDPWSRLFPLWGGGNRGSRQYHHSDASCDSQGLYQHSG